MGGVILFILIFYILHVAKNAQNVKKTAFFNENLVRMENNRGTAKNLVRVRVRQKSTGTGTEISGRLVRVRVRQVGTVRSLGFIDAKRLILLQKNYELQIEKSRLIVRGGSRGCRG